MVLKIKTPSASASASGSSAIGVSSIAAGSVSVAKSSFGEIVGGGGGAVVFFTADDDISSFSEDASRPEFAPFNQGNTNALNESSNTASTKMKMTTFIKVLEKPAAVFA